jgi:uncharacterized membrane protein YdjX (TVP38/TMEM64 family)
LSIRLIEFLVIAAIVVLIGVIPPVRAAIVPSFYFLATGQLAQFQHHLQSYGMWAPVISIMLMIAEALMIPITAAIIMVANGLVFGFWYGMLVSFIGGFLGAVCAYSIGRRFGRAAIERFVPGSVLLEADRLMKRYGKWAIVLERWIPGIPGDPVSYASGLTRIPAGQFLALTSVALLPANIVTAYVGEQVAGDVPLKYWLSGVAVVAAAIAWRWWRRRRH